MTLITRIFAVTALLSLARAAHVSHGGDLVARKTHQHHAREVTSDNTTAIEERGPARKVGLCWNNGEDQKMSHYVTAKTKYIYTWSPYCPPETAKVGLVCCPMLWGTKQTKQFQSLRGAKGTQCLMGMNEVNVPSQSYMTPAAGIKLWNSEVRPSGKNGITLVSPSVTCGDDGIDWFKQFFAGCGGNDKCGVTALSVHSYVTTPKAFQDWMTKFHDTFGLKIWVTEFACQSFGNGKQCTKDQVWAFMTQVTAWMDNTPWIEAYFAFGILHDMYNVNVLNQMMGKDGLPNDLGRFYLGA